MLRVAATCDLAMDRCAAIIRQLVSGVLPPLLVTERTYDHYRQDPRPRNPRLSRQSHAGGRSHAGRRFVRPRGRAVGCLDRYQGSGGAA
ncbi:hypothetical protein XAP6164_890021 [Xanthomonas phaseoli pv. phaseoli]|nr:hypothetical protein XAP6164_890021 [Xanthomonas phaseoli pv. phaseoli]